MCKAIATGMIAAIPLIVMFTAQAAAVDLAVGFDLSLDYGTASIYFANGSTVDIAKVEGGPAYKQLMRAGEVQHADDSSTHIIRPASSLQSLRDYLTPWMGGQRDPGARALLPLLTALKAAAESYLETSISAAEVVVPFPVSIPYLDSLRSACSYLSLLMPRSTQPPAGILAARAHGIGGTCDPYPDETTRSTWEGYDPDQLILTVDYSRAALTGLLVVEGCGVFEDRRVLHDTSLGTDNLDSGDNYIGARDNLERALRNLTSLPLEDGNGKGLRQISHLVLMGESAGDARLKEALKEVLRGQLSPYLASTSVLGEDVVDGSTGGKLTTQLTSTNVIDPLFAASRGVALDCWDRLTWKERSESGGDHEDL